jgi:hypothetical protein
MLEKFMRLLNPAISGITSKMYKGRWYPQPMFVLFVYKYRINDKNVIWIWMDASFLILMGSSCCV